MKKWILLSGMALLLASCEKENKQDRECPNAVEKEFTLSGFNRIYAAETFKLTVKKGNDFSIKSTGCTSDLHDLQMKITHPATLDISFTDYQANRYAVEIEITLPQLHVIVLSGDAKADISGFAGQNYVLRNILSGTAQCNVNGTAVNTQVDLTGKAVLHISGITESLYGYISGDAQLNGYNTEATEVDIATSGLGRAYVKPVDIIYADAAGESRVYYRGNPPHTILSTSGNGKIIHE